MLRSRVPDWPARSPLVGRRAGRALAGALAAGLLLAPAASQAASWEQAKHDIKAAAHETGRAIVATAHATGHTIRHAAHAVGQAVHRAVHGD